MVLDYPNELLLLEEAWFGLLEDGKDEFEANYLCSDHIIADLLVTFGLLLALD